MIDIDTEVSIWRALGKCPNSFLALLEDVVAIRSQQYWASLLDLDSLFARKRLILSV